VRLLRGGGGSHEGDLSGSQGGNRSELQRLLLDEATTTLKPGSINVSAMRAALFRDTGVTTELNVSVANSPDGKAVAEGLQKDFSEWLATNTPDWRPASPPAGTLNNKSSAPQANPPDPVRHSNKKLRRFRFKIVDHLRNWMRANRIRWDEEAIEIRSSVEGLSGMAMGVFASRDISAGEILCTIPKETCLTVKTSSISEILQGEGLDGQLGLIVAVLHEWSLGASSKWHEYLAALPSREYLPFFWRGDELKLLKGIGLIERADEDMADLRDDFEDVVLPLARKNNATFRVEYITLKNFKRAASWVSSRAFQVDPKDGDGMIPLGDLFNHKLALVESSEIPEDGWGEAESGSHGESSTDVNDSYAQNQHREDYWYQLRRGEVVSSALGLQAHSKRMEIEFSSQVESDAIQIVASSNITKGNEIHNFYGPWSNDELVYRYGFCLEEKNPFDTVKVRKELFLDAAIELFGYDRAYDGSLFMREHTNLLHHQHVDHVLFEILPCGYVNPELLSAMQLMLDPDNSTREHSLQSFQSASMPHMVHIKDTKWFSVGTRAILLHIIEKCVMGFVKVKGVTSISLIMSEVNGMATEESVSKRAAILLRKSQMKIFSDAIGALKESPLQDIKRGKTDSISESYYHHPVFETPSLKKARSFDERIANLSKAVASPSLGK